MTTDVSFSDHINFLEKAAINWRFFHIINCFLSMTLHCNRYSPSLGIFRKVSVGDCCQNELTILIAADSTSHHASIIANTSRKSDWIK